MAVRNLFAATLAGRMGATLRDLAARMERGEVAAIGLAVVTVDGETEIGHVGKHVDPLTLVGAIRVLETSITLKELREEWGLWDDPSDSD